MSQRFEINTGVICAEDGGGRCPDGAPSVYSRPFSPSWPRLTALRSPAGGLAAAYSGQEMDGISVTIHLWAAGAVESATEGQDTAERTERSGHVLNRIKNHQCFIYHTCSPC